MEGIGSEGSGDEMKGRVFLLTYGCVPIHHFGKSGGRRMKSLSHLPRFGRQPTRGVTAVKVELTLMVIAK